MGFVVTLIFGEIIKVKIPEPINTPPDANTNWYRLRIKEYPTVKKLINLIREKRVKVECILEFNKWDIFGIVENLKFLGYQNNNFSFLTSLS